MKSRAWKVYGSQPMPKLFTSRLAARWYRWRLRCLGIGSGFYEVAPHGGLENHLFSSGLGGIGRKGAAVYRLVGYDTFAGEPYPLGTIVMEDGTTFDGMQPEYATYEEALADACRRLDDLERTQPSGPAAGGSGGQGPLGIQDRVYVVHPDGHWQRVFPKTGGGRNQGQRAS
jgi:hypothetical protein